MNLKLDLFAAGLGGLAAGLVVRGLGVRELQAQITLSLPCHYEKRFTKGQRLPGQPLEQRSSLDSGFLPQHQASGPTMAKLPDGAI